MRCPFCQSDETQVKDSRPADENAAIRRRRSCSGCGGRFTTFERIQLRDMSVVKSDNKIQPLDRDKIIRSMRVALQKRPHLKGFYRSFGFKQYGTQKVFLGPDDEEFDLVLMDKHF